MDNKLRSLTKQDLIAAQRKLIDERHPMINGEYYEVFVSGDVLEDLMDEAAVADARLGMSYQHVPHIDRLKIQLAPRSKDGSASDSQLTCSHAVTIWTSSKSHPDKAYRTVVQGKPKVLGVSVEDYPMCTCCYGTDPSINPKHAIPAVFEYTDQCVGVKLGPLNNVHYPRDKDIVCDGE